MTAPETPPPHDTGGPGRTSRRAVDQGGRRRAAVGRRRAVRSRRAAALTGSLVATGALLAGAATAVLTLPVGGVTHAVQGVLGGGADATQLAAVDGPADGSAERGAAASRSGARTPVEEVLPPVTAPQETLVSADPPVLALPPGLSLADVEAGLLSADVPESAAGTFTTVPGSDPGPGTGRVRTIRVEVEDGLAVDGQKFAQTVMATLNDPRGWGADGSLSFARTDGAAELRVLLASPDTIDELCAPLDTGGQVSCGTKGHAALNLRRWVEATQELSSDKVTYRQYLVNHEVGHLLGHRHQSCPGPGQRAPLMQQQSYRAAPCVPNPWPFPEG